eukprot:Rhum_TRINITY_DN15183_c1_g3::Rhum_TRINITY_DN15183_c1_g3_i3::g.142243::m.142243
MPEARQRRFKKVWISSSVLKKFGLTRTDEPRRATTTLLLNRRSHSSLFASSDPSVMTRIAERSSTDATGVSSVTCGFSFSPAMIRSVRCSTRWKMAETPISRTRRMPPTHPWKRDDAIVPDSYLRASSKYVSFSMLRSAANMPGHDGRTRARAASLTYSTPVPGMPRSHLNPAQARTSTPSATTSSGTTPAPWIASTTKSAPTLCARALSARRSARNPLLNCTCAVDTTRVRASTAAAKLSAAMRRSSPTGTSRTSTPFACRSYHGKVLFQCSFAGTTTLSPSFQSRPFATMPRPAHVLVTSA